MKVITEALVRAQLKATKPKVFYIPEGNLLSPAAREYLNQIKVAIDFEKNKVKTSAKEENSCTKTDSPATLPTASKPKYIDYETGAEYAAKPEHMTQLFGNMLVDKNHPRIRFRGKIDRLQADVIYAQSVIKEAEDNSGLLKDLDNILGILREIMKCEVLDEEFSNDIIIGLTHDELREHSHNPMKYYNIKQMLLPEYSMGVPYALLNLIRTSIREAEVLAVDAFKTGRRMEKEDIVEELNRLSSALHIIMCRYLGGFYNTK